MENTQYHDSPPSSRSSSPTRRPRSPSTSSSHSSSTIKPLPPTPHAAPVYEPYHDEPSSTHRDEQTTHHDEPSTTYRADASPHPPAYQQPYTDSTPPTPAATDDNIPLAFLLPTYPPTSPPPYSVAIQTRDTLVQYTRNAHAPYMPNHHQHPYPPIHSTPIFPISSSQRRDVLIEIDPESGEVVSRTDDVRHGVEKVVAMFVVAVVLLFLSGFLGFIALGS